MALAILPACHVQGTEHLNLNSGCFYLVANDHTRALMQRVAARLAVEVLACPLSHASVDWHHLCCCHLHHVTQRATPSCNVVK